MRAHATQAVLGLVLLAELLGLTLTFDTARLDGIPTLWAQLVNWAPQYLRLAITIAVASLGLTALGQPSNLRDWFSEKPPASRLPALAVHAAALAMFALLTSAIVRADAAFEAHQAFWTLAWLLSGAAMVGGWALALWPLGVWVACARQHRITIAWGTAIGLVVWTSGSVSQEFWIPLARVTFGLVAWMLSLVYTTIVSDPSRLVLGTPTFKVAISPECSGYEGVGLLLVFLSVYLWLFRRELRFPGALILLPIGAVVIWLANAVRILVLIVIGTAGWRDVALGGFHSQAGWIAFNAIALGFVGITNHFGCFKANTGTPPGELPARGNDNPTAAYLGPFLVITAMAMVTGAVAAGFDWLYPMRVVAAAVVLWLFRKHYAQLNWSFSWWSFAIGIVTFVVWLALVPGGTNRNVGWPDTLRAIPIHWAAIWMAFRTLGYVVMTPLAEELAFRAFLTRRLAGADFERVPLGQFAWLPFLLSSLLFGALHGGLWIAGTLAGMAFALALYRRRRFGDAVLAHATTNALLAAYAWTTGQWSVWS